MIKVRAALPIDAIEIARVHIASWQSAYRGHMPDDILDTLDLERRATSWRIAIERQSPSTGIFVAEREGSIAGFCSCGEPHRNGASGIAELHTMYVQPNATGSGLGGALLRQAEQHLAASGFATATLMVLEANHAARRFYERHGWIDTGERGDETVGGAVIRGATYRKTFG